MLWRRTKIAYLAASESRSKGESEVAKVRKAHLQAVERLDKAVVSFEKLPGLMKKIASKKPMNWKKLVDGIATAATALSKATDGPAPINLSGMVEAKVIDMPADD